MPTGKRNRARPPARGKTSAIAEPGLAPAKDDIISCGDARLTAVRNTIPAPPHIAPLSSRIRLVRRTLSLPPAASSNPRIHSQP